MSSLVSPVRASIPRTALKTGWKSVEKARLSLVPAARSRAPRAPFAVLVLAVLGIGVVGLLVFNTHMQQASFYATTLQQQADDLTAQQQKLDMELEALRDPQRVGEEARRLGLVAPPAPTFIRLSDGAVVGETGVATPEGAVAITPPPARRTGPLVVPPIRVTVRVPAKKPAAGGPASTNAGAATGTNGTPNTPQNTSQGAQR